MPTEAHLYLEPRHLFTAPWEPVIERRGDALGLRALADEFADALAPDLSNRVTDGRWITILAWCLMRSQEVFHASGGRFVATRAEQRERYAWLRPLELMWVARTIAVVEDWAKRPLAGRRRVQPWYKNHQSPDRFGMSVDQFRACRQTGMYGGYRVAFRKWPGMTVNGDGWTPGPATIRLAEWLDDKLGGAGPPWPLHIDDVRDFSARSVKLHRGKEHLWWLKNWKDFAQADKNADLNTLPRRRDDFNSLPERKLLKPLLFGDDEKGKLRLRVVGEIANAAAADHYEVCKHLAGAFAGNPAFVLLPHFSRLADAGMHAMDLIARSLQKDSRVRLADAAAHPEAAGICEELTAAAHEWRLHAQMQLRHVQTANRFADEIQSAQPIECLGALLQHHERHGGGLRWFLLRDGWVEPHTPQRGGASMYRFRLWSLCRLATQCGVLLNMPSAFLENVETEEGQISEAADE